MVQTRSQTTKPGRPAIKDEGHRNTNENQDEVPVQISNRSFEIPRWAVLLGAVGLAGLISIMIYFFVC